MTPKQNRAEAKKHGYSTLNKSNTFGVNVDLYSYKMTVYYGTSLSEAYNHMNHFKLLTDDSLKLVKNRLEKGNEGSAGWFLSDTRFNGIIWLHEQRSAILAHELIHVACEILDMRGIPISKDNDEVIAYLHTHMMEQVIGK